MFYMHTFATELAYFSSGVKGDTGGGVGDAENAGNPTSFNTISMYLLKMQD